MNIAVASLSPKAVWSCFEALNAVPRPSKKEERVIQFIIDFAQKLHLNCQRDKVGNVLVKKSATKGFEKRQTVVLQAHLDMVHQKNNDTEFDFESMGIRSIIDGDWVRAKGTTLGADNGIGVAMIMAILQSTDIEHPAIEALFTIDEETGMTGAKNLNPNWLSGNLLFNLDTEDDKELCFGCAGGIDTNTKLAYQPIPVASNSKAYKLVVKGLLGGHSGMDIHLERGNANKIMNRLLWETAEGFNLQLAKLLGGSLRNAIPRESYSIIAVNNQSDLDFENKIAETAKKIKAMLATAEPNIQIILEPCSLPEMVVPNAVLKAILLSIGAVHNGVFRWSREMDKLVETSSSLALVKVEDGSFITQSLQRSSVETGKEEVALAVRAAFEAVGCTVEQSGDYPGWAPNAKSPALLLLSQVYKDVFKSEPLILACHAGLECGLLGKNYPNIHMVSFGPTILGAHSPDERVSIQSVQKSWQLLTSALKAVSENI